MEPTATHGPAQARCHLSSVGNVGPRRYDWSDADIRRALEAVPGLSLLQEQLLFRVCCLSLQRGYAWVAPEELAKLLRCSLRTLYSATKAVCGLGLLRTTRDSAGLSYLPQWPALGLVDKPRLPAKVAPSIRQKLPMLQINDLDRQPRQQQQSPEPAAASELSQVRQKFGPEAEADVVDVLASWPARRNPQAAQAALARLLAMALEDIRTTPGATFRALLALACEGRLALKQTGQGRAPDTPLGALLDRLARAKLRGDWELVSRLETERIELAAALRRKAAS